MLKKISLFFMIVIFALACQPEIDPPVDPPKKNCLISKMIQGTHNGLQDDTTFTFYYNDTSRLERVNMAQPGSSYELDCELHYDNQNRLIEATGYQRSEYIYNAKGLLSEIHFTKFADSAKIEYYYGTGDLPTSSRSSQKNRGQWYPGRENRYTWLNGNVVKVESYDNGVLKSSQSFDYYEDVPNYFRLHSLLSVYPVPLGPGEPFSFFNKNLLKKAGFPNSRYFDYKLDSGLVVSSITTWLSEPSNDSTQRDTRFYYYNCK